MARPAKKGLAYFPKDVDFYQDEKIVDLGMKYGPLGLTVFDVLMTLVYREGYYLELPLSKVGQLIVRTVGESWFRKTGMSAVDLSVEVILYCAEIGLINAPLVRQNVITSVGIQKRYAAVTARNKVNLTKYWLLDNRKVDGALESMPKKRVSVAETPVSVTETRVSDTKTPQRKENKTKENISDDIARVSVAETPVSVTETRVSDTKTPQRKENKTKENISDDIARVSVAETPVSVTEIPEFSTGTTDDKDERIAAVISEFARILPGLPKPTASARLIRNLSQSAATVEDFAMVFERASRSSFLSAASWCTIEWITTPENAEKVLTGRYDDFAKRGEKAPARESRDTDRSGVDEMMRLIYQRSAGGGYESES